MLACWLSTLHLRPSFAENKRCNQPLPENGCRHCSKVKIRYWGNPSPRLGSKPTRGDGWCNAARRAQCVHTPRFRAPWSIRREPSGHPITSASLRIAMKRPLPDPQQRGSRRPDARRARFPENPGQHAAFIDAAQRRPRGQRRRRVDHRSSRNHPAGEAPCVRRLQLRVRSTSTPYLPRPAPCGTPRAGSRGPVRSVVEHAGPHSAAHTRRARAPGRSCC